MAGWTAPRCWPPSSRRWATDPVGSIRRNRHAETTGKTLRLHRRTERKPLHPGHPERDAGVYALYHHRVHLPDFGQYAVRGLQHLRQLDHRPGGRRLAGQADDRLLCQPEHCRLSGAADRQLRHRSGAGDRERYPGPGHQRHRLPGPVPAGRGQHHGPGRPGRNLDVLRHHRCPGGCPAV